MRDLDWRGFDVLVVDDEEDNLDAFRFAFRKAFSLHYALGGQEALNLLERLDPAVIVSDQRMPGMSGIEFLRRAKERRPDTVGILLTAYTDLPVLIDALNSGAVERYIQKPWDSKELTVILRQAIGSFATVRENRRLREQLAHYAGYLEREQRDPIDFGQIAGESPAMKELGERIALGAPTSSPVLIEGEQGSEKEVVARAIHVGSPREERPFVKVTCAAFRGDALERELFGWKRGAFDGAFDDRAGRFELAHRGTIFLEEPAALSPSLQGRLLRLLTDGEVERVGATEAIPVDVRVVVSLTPTMSEAWSETEVLPELCSRLAVFPVHLPPLRDRRGDIRVLAEHFLRKYAQRNPRAATSLSNEAVSRLEGYAWPGNVRELENVIERAAILSRSDVIQPEHLAFSAPGYGRGPQRSDPSLMMAPPSSSPPASPSSPPQEEPPGRIDLDSQLEDIERRELIAALQRCNGNKAEVARSLGMQRTTLYYRLKKLGIES
ncbi:Response regulator of zinc sigma-54-dependent two-component system [Minicystis rosea]|nr:Response regulator of zinc sigma-54-dependent two-component system [Minicystis rosea]